MVRRPAQSEDAPRPDRFRVRPVVLPKWFYPDSAMLRGLLPEARLLTDEAERRELLADVQYRLWSHWRAWALIPLILVFFAPLGFGIWYGLTWLRVSSPMAGGIAGGVVGMGATACVAVFSRRTLRRHARDLLWHYGVPVCHACGYSLVNLPGERCPECGEAFDLAQVEEAQAKRDAVA